jgi:hypothetical protein
VKWLMVGKNRPKQRGLPAGDGVLPTKDGVLPPKDGVYLLKMGCT